MFSIPLEYNEPMIYNLAIRLTPDKFTKVHPSVAYVAEESLRDLMDYNALEMLASPVKLESAIVCPPGTSGAVDFKSGGYL